MRELRGSTLATWSSVATHAVIFGLLALISHHALRVRMVQSRGGERTILYWQGEANRSPQATRKLAVARKFRKIPIRQPHVASSTASETDPSQNKATNGLGGSQAGSKDITPAYPVFSPSPHIADRSLLPRTTTNVVIDVNVSAQGDVLAERLIQGLGNSLDQIVLDTVKKWKFHPANDNGNAVESVAELIFPFSPKWTG